MISLKSIKHFFSPRNRTLRIINTMVFAVVFSVHGELMANVVGKIPGNFSVSPTGAASYSIPIEAPRGVNGLQPELSLAYNSQGGNGLLGQGWALSGRSAITRCPQNYAQDGNIHGVDFTNEDRLCLDAQRLVLIGGDNADDNAYWSDTAEYRTEIEAFAKITRFDSGFKIETKDGKLIEYGNTSDSSQNVRVSSTNEQPILNWAIAKVSDLSGNYMSYVYTEDIVAGEHLLAEINYAGNLNVGTPTYASVRLSYESLSSSEERYYAGAKLTSSVRLSSIKTYTNNVLINDYRLAYQESNVTNSFLLKSVQLCSEASSCLLPIAITWDQATSSGWQSAPEYIPPYTITADGIGDLGVRFIDVNGDGLVDMVYRRFTAAAVIKKGAYINTGAGWQSAPEYIPPYTITADGIGDLGVRFIDVNGDGLVDMVYNRFFTGAGVTEKGAYINTGAGWQSAPEYTPPYTIMTDGIGDLGVRFIDVNGDGLVDMVYRRFFTGAGVTEKGAYINTGAGWQSAPEYTPPYTIMTDGIGDLGVRFIDVNGDGLVDMVYNRFFTGAGVTEKGAYINTGAGWQSAPEYTPPYTITADGIGDLGVRFIDVNGDGLVDMVYRRFTAAAVIKKGAYINTGAGWQSAPEYIPPYTITADGIGDLGVRFIDVNGDGLVDMVYRRFTAAAVIKKGAYINTGAGWQSAPEYIPPYTITADGIGDLGVRFIDVNGDGLVDMVYRRFTAAAVTKKGAYINRAARDVVVAITDSFGATTSISYDYLTNKDIYNKDVDAEYPIVDSIDVFNVVSTATQDNGIDGITISYKYGGAKLHALGRGMLGFGWRESVNQQTGLKERTRYAQVRNNAITGKQEPDFPYMGAIVSVTKSLSDGIIINAVNNAHDAVGAYPYMVESISQEYDLNGVLMSTVTKTNSLVDDFGNILQEKTVVNDAGGAAWVTETSNNFANTSSPVWHEKFQLTRQTATNTGKDSVSVINTKSFTYNTSGLLETETSEPGSLLYELVTTYAYDSFGNRASATVSGVGIDARTASTQYDSNGRFLLTATNAHGHTDTRTYDPVLGVLNSITDSNGLVATSEYDSFGRNTLTVSPDGTRIATTRDWCSVVGCTIEPITVSNVAHTAVYTVTTRFLASDGLTEHKPSVTTYFDKLQREIRVETTGFGGETIYQDTNYDDRGRASAKTVAYDASLPSTKYPTINTYDDPLGRLTRQENPRNGITDIAYSGLTMTRTNNGQVGIQKKNAIGQVVSETDNDYQILTFEYNAQGKRSKSIDPLGNTLVIAYDDLGRKTSMDDPDMGRWEYTYDALGQLKTQKDAKNQITQMYYDKLGRMIKRVDSDGLATEWVFEDNLLVGDFDNKLNGKLKSERMTRAGAADFDYSKSYTYDSLKRASTTTVAINDGILSQHATSVSYDTVGRIDIVEYPESAGGPANRFKVKRSYKNGFLESVTSPDGVIPYWTAKARNSRGSPTQETFANGAMELSGYDEAGRRRFVDIGKDLSTYFRGDYSYDAIGNLDSCMTQHSAGSSLGVTETHSYDTLNRLTDIVASNSASPISLAYDGLGNITSKNSAVYEYSPTRPHAVNAVDAVAYTYDANGNMLSGDGRTITWSAYNKPMQIENADVRLNFKYGSGRARYQKTVFNKTSNTTDNKITYIGNLFEVHAKSTVIEYKHYIRAGNETVAVHTRRTDSTNETSYLHRDYLGSVVVVTDEVGNAKANFSYDAFGSRRPVDGEAAVSPFSLEFARSYTDHEYLNDVDLIHMNGRVYDPKLGRFISADPLIQFKNNLQSYNRYSYVLNNPLGYTDPSGFSLWTDVRDTTLGLAAAPFVVGVAVGAVVVASAAITTLGPTYAHAQGIKNSETYRRLNGYATPFLPPPLAALNGGFTTAVLGGDLEAIALSAFASYTTAASVEGFYTALRSFSPYVASAQWAGNIYMRQKATEKISEIADRNGMSTGEFNMALFAISSIGNLVTESRFDMQNELDVYGVNLIDGIGNRGALGAVFDVADLMLAYQGIPTASAIDYLLNGNSSLPLIGYSAGALDANTLVTLGLADTATLVSLPFFGVSTSNSSVELGSRDFVNGGWLGHFLNPQATVVNRDLSDHMFGKNYPSLPWTP